MPAMRYSPARACVRRMDEQDEAHALDAPDRFAGRLGHGAVERRLSHAIVPFMEEKEHNCQLRQEKLRRGVKLEAGEKNAQVVLKGRTLQRVAEDLQKTSQCSSSHSFSAASARVL